MEYAGASPRGKHALGVRDGGLDVRQDGRAALAEAIAANSSMLVTARDVQRLENDLILQALQRTEWNKNKAAALLKLNRTTLVEKIKRKEIAVAG